MDSLFNRGLAIVGVGLLPILAIQVYLATHTNSPHVLAAVVGDLLSLTLIGGLSFWLIRDPIVGLLDAVENWHAGSLADGISPTRAGREIVRLVSAFDAKVATLGARQKALLNALESTTDVVFVLDRDWRYTYRNPRAEEVFSGGDLTGEVIWDIFPDRSQSIFGKSYRAAMETGVAGHVQGFEPSLNGYWATHAYPSKHGLTVFARDMTEEYQTAAALRASEERLRVALAATCMGVREFNLVTGEANWTKEAAAILGRDHSSDPSIEAWRAGVHPEDWPQVKAKWDGALANPDGQYKAEYRYLQPDGSWRWIGAFSRVQFEAGRAVRAICVVQDIDARKGVDEALKESETRLQLAHQAAGFGLWDWDYTTRSGIWSVDQWRLFGLQPNPGGWHPDAWTDYIHPGDLQRVLAERKAAFASDTALIDNEYRVVWPNGEVRWLVVKGGIVRDQEGKVARVVGVSLDVTASRQTEAALRQLGAELEARVFEETAAREAAQLRAARAERMQALGLLAGGIAHDFNNILQTVSGAIAIIARRAGDQPDVGRLTQLAAEATDRGSSITRRLLAFGRRGDLRSEAIDPSALFNELIEILEHTLGAGIDIQVGAEPDLDPLLADKSQLETCLVNLAMNARDAMPCGGQLFMSADVDVVGATHTDRIPALKPGRYVRLTIEDTGVGMDAATLARASEPFFTTKAIGAGTGLGLAMCKGFVEQSGGAMAVESGPGRGTTIKLWLPVAAAAAFRSIQVASPDTGDVNGSASIGGRVRVLLVDDDHPLREILALSLEDADLHVLAAASGPEALALLGAGETVHVLVTDLSMPGMDGLALIRAVHQRYPGLPTVLLTGYAGDGTDIGVEEADEGTFSLLRKPSTAREIADCIGELLAAREDVSRRLETSPMRDEDQVAVAL